MKKASQIALAIAFATAATTGVAQAQGIDNWVNTDNQVWKNGDGSLCWQDSYWTPATAAVGCGRPAPAPAPAPREIVAQKVTFNADTFFDFDKSTLKPEGRRILDQVAQQSAQLVLESILATGHTDSIGTEKYNQALSERRANAVKQYLASRGVPADQIVAQGRGELQPVADNKTKQGRAKNRRVEVEIIGTRR